MNVQTAWICRDRLTGLMISRDGKLTRQTSRAALFTTRNVARIAAERFSAKYGVSMSTKHCMKIQIQTPALNVPATTTTNAKPVANAKPKSAARKTLATTNANA